MKARVLPAFLLLIFAAMACNMPLLKQAPSANAAVTATVTPAEAEVLLTQVALTVNANLTQPATVVAAPPTTPVPPTATQAPAPTSIPPSATPLPCDRASFGQDVTVPDGTKFNPGATFTKTWRLKNIANCTWTRDYAIVFVSGDSMGAPAVVNLPTDVPPNGMVDISVEMRAPLNPGKHVGYWRLRNSAGQQFGIGGDQPFYVQIEVTPVTATVTTTVTPTITTTVSPTAAGGLIYDFQRNLCQADWRSQSGMLPCPGIIGDLKGYADRLRNPQLENGLFESGPVILTHPNDDNDGAITGQYPPITIQQGYRFQAGLACQYGKNQCSVIYQLNYIGADGQPASLGQWARTYNGSLQLIDVDLSPLAGQQVQLILAVLSNGSPNDDDALWIYPRIIKP